MTFEIIDPTKYPKWDERLLELSDASFFLGSAWARVLCDSYGYRPFFFISLKKGLLGAIFAVLEINSLLTGKRGVSLPFTDFCDPVVPSDVCFHELFNEIKAFGRKRGWKYLEVRGGSSFFQQEAPAQCFYGHTLDLSKGIENAYSNFRDSTRRNIKKAEREGVKVAIQNSMNAVEEFYRLNCMTRKDHGLPPQPFSFFENIHRHVLAKEMGFVALASIGGKAIAGSVFFRFGDKAIYKYGASDKKYRQVRANNFLMWESIKWYEEKGCKGLHFGRTERENEGLRQFKNGWGTEEKAINYYRYDLDRDAFISNISNTASRAGKLFSKLPLPLLKSIGNIFYKHVG